MSVPDSTAPVSYTADFGGTDGAPWPSDFTAAHGGATIQSGAGVLAIDADNWSNSFQIPALPRILNLSLTMTVDAALMAGGGYGEVDIYREGPGLGGDGVGSRIVAVTTGSDADVVRGAGMPTTPHYNLPYPAGTIGVPPDPRGDLQALATAVDTNIYAEVHAAVLETADSGWSIAVATLSAGWGSKTDSNGNTTNVVGGIRKVGQRVEVRIRATRTGSAITPGATGNFTDTPIMQLASGYFPASNVYGTFVQPGLVGGICRVETTGLIQLTNAFNASSTIANGAVVQVQVDYFVN
jgi:hypothetical protein